MPSTILGNPAASGAQVIVSGFPWSGRLIPVGGVQLYWDQAASGSCYVGLSGGTTVTSGGMFLSGGGLLDGMKLTPGGAYWVPRSATGLSGNLSLYAACDPACSGVGRLYYEVF